MNWELLITSIEKSLINRNLKSEQRFKELRKLDALVKNHFPDIVTNPYLLLEKNKSDFRKEIEHILNKKLNGAEISLLNDIYRMIPISDVFTKDINEPEFFNLEEIEIFSKNILKKYRVGDQKLLKVGQYLKNTVYKKTNFWASHFKDDWEIKLDNRWLGIGSVIKKYSWARVYKSNHRDKKIFFTLGADGNYKSLIYKLDCQKEGGNPLSFDQITKFRSIVNQTEAYWQEISLDLLKDYNWDKLFKETEKFIKKYKDLYEAVIKYVWYDIIPRNFIKRGLFLKNPPPAINKTPIDKNRKFRGVEIDYLNLYKENKKLGDFGEQIVLKEEKKKLKENGLNHLVKEVVKVKDGNGYDIISFDLNERKIFIEVKTSYKNDTSSIPVSSNEIEFMKLNSENSFIYRLFNANIKNDYAEYFILNYQEMLKRYNLIPTSYSLSLK